MKATLFVAQGFLLLVLTAQLGFSKVVVEEATTVAAVEGKNLPYNPYSAENADKTRKQVKDLLKNYDQVKEKVYGLEVNSKPFPNISEIVNSNADLVSIKSRVLANHNVLCAGQLDLAVQKLIEKFDKQLESVYENKVEILREKLVEVNLIVNYDMDSAYTRYANGFPNKCLERPDCGSAMTGLKKLKEVMEFLEAALNPDGDYFKEVYDVKDDIASDIKFNLVHSIQNC